MPDIDYAALREKLIERMELDPSWNARRVEFLRDLADVGPTPQLYAALWNWATGSDWEGEGSIKKLLRPARWKFTTDEIDFRQVKAWGISAHGEVVTASSFTARAAVIAASLEAWGLEFKTKFG